MQEVKGKLATYIIKLFNTEPVLAVFDIGVTCSCISVSLYDHISKKVTMVEKNLRVGQADGTCLGLKDLVKVLIEINDNHFEHLFIVCQHVKNLYSLVWILHNDTKLGLTSAWHNGAMPLCISRLTNHDNYMDDTSNRLGTGLVTITTMTIPLHHMAAIPIASSFNPHTNITIELIEVIENPLLHIEQLCLCILDTLHKFYNENQNKCVTLAANISDKELRINKGIQSVSHV